MKTRFALTALLLCLGAAAGAQNMYDAIAFSQTNNFGTARSAALGGAGTALGGDLGMVATNPAGSAVAGYGQAVVTQNISISGTSSAYAPYTTDFGAASNRNRARYITPDFGASLAFNTGNRKGLRRVTIAFFTNQSYDYNSYADAYGRNGKTSKAGELASAAWGLDESVLANANSYSSSGVPWDVLTGYQGGLIASTSSVDGSYIGITQGFNNRGLNYVPGELSQSAEYSKTGVKKEAVFNIGFDFSDKFYFGVNIGTPRLSYDYFENFSESAVNTDNFPIYYDDDAGIERTDYFKSASYGYHYAADVKGSYVKLGMIFLPTRHLRVGATVQLPGRLKVSETFQYEASTRTVEGEWNDNASSPVGEYSYKINTPYSIGAGLAYSVDRGLLSVDYELVDYSSMRFTGVDTFRALNETNRRFAGVQHIIRAGLEFKLNKSFAVRAGYSFMTDPERTWSNDLGEIVDASTFSNNFDDYDSHARSLVSYRYNNSLTRTASLGFGYSSSGSFFADFVCRLTRYPTFKVSPYYDYDVYDKDGKLLDVASPVVKIDRNLWNLALTVGWRF